MDPGQQSQQQRANGFMGDGVLGMNRNKPQIDQRVPPMDFVNSGQQRYWQQDFTNQYDMYRGAVPGQPPQQQPITIFPQVNGPNAPGRAPARHPYIPARGQMGGRYDDPNGYQSIPEDFELLSHAQQQQQPQAGPGGPHVVGGTAQGGVQQMHQQPPPQQQQQQQHQQQQQQQQQQSMVPGPPMMVKPLPEISPAPQRRLKNEPDSEVARKASRLNLAQGSPHPGDAQVSQQLGGNGRHDENESDLKRIAIDSLRFPIERAVAHVREDDNSPLAEKSRQVFGMSWLLRSCETKADANVPRNRIYAHYVAACDEFKLKPLNHATFGKLVRMVFPNIKTRRLGVRGHSKYHYCGVALLDSIASLACTPSPSMTPRSGLIDSFSPSSMQTESPPVNTSVASISAQSFISSTSTPIKEQKSRAQSPSSANSSFIVKPYAEELWEILRGRESAFSVPQLTDFLEADADPDVVATLFGLYKSQCRALFPHLKSFQYKAFLNQYASFQSGLTVPVQRLLHRLDTLRWVTECDKRFFDEVLCMLAPLALKPLTPEIEHGLQVLAVSFPQCIDQHRKSMPQSYIQMKKGMIDKVVRVVNLIISTSEAAGNLHKIFMNPGDLQAMKNDWTRFVTNRCVEDVVSCDPNLAAMIITEEVPRITDTVDGSQDPLWYSMQLLSHLKDRFPNVDTRLFLLTVSSVATTALKEINRAGGVSFGCWWMYRTWSDDWLAFVNELMQFLQLSTAHFGTIKLDNESQQ